MSRRYAYSFFYKQNRTSLNAARAIGEERFVVYTWVARDVGVSVGDPCNPASFGWLLEDSDLTQNKQHKCTNTRNYVVQHDVPTSTGIKGGNFISGFLVKKKVTISLSPSLENNLRLRARNCSRWKVRRNLALFYVACEFSLIGKNP